MDRGLLVVPQSIRRRRMPQSNHHFFFFNDTATTEIYTLSLHDALPISGVPGRTGRCVGVQKPAIHVGGDAEWTSGLRYGGVSAGASAARRGGKGKKTSSAGSPTGPFPRRKDLRHFRHQEPEASGGGADLPRIAYTYSSDGSER